MWLVKSVLPSIRLYYHLARRRPVINRYALYTLLSNSHFSSEKARAQLGYQTRPFAETLADAIAWLRSEQWIPSARAGTQGD
jgi:dihydroflavonol-4-reductase